MLAASFVDVFSIVLELRTVDLEVVNTSDVPSQTVVNLLDFPVFQKDSAPYTG